MTAAPDPAAPPLPRRARRLVLLGLPVLLLGGAGGFAAMRLLGPVLRSPAAAAPLAPLPGDGARAAPAYVAIEPVVVTLPRASGRQFLRFAATLEVEPDAAAAVAALMPRIVDVMNGYLRAVEPADFESRMILADLRSQLLRRIRVVTGEGQVRDLLVIEFVLN